MNHPPSSPPLAKDLMNPEAVPLKPGKFGKDLALQFLSGQYGGWPVVDPTHKLLGVVTEFRLLQAISRLASLNDLRVEDTMAGPVYVYEQDTLDIVLNVMVQHHVLRLPVVGDRNLVGVISRGHVLRHSLPFPSPSLRFVSSCAWCERVHNPSQGTGREKGWEDLREFLLSQHLSFSQIDLVSTYCPSCLDVLKGLSSTAPDPSPDDMDRKSSCPCLMVVDDDHSMTRVLGEALHEWGYKVLIARNGREGLDLVERRPVDGILLDMHMPVMDGPTMLDELRWRGHQMPVLMMSGGSDERVLRQLLQEGAQGFFLKPFHLASLRQACRQVLDRQTTASGINSSASSHSHVA